MQVVRIEINIDIQKEIDKIYNDIANKAQPDKIEYLITMLGFFRVYIKQNKQEQAFYEFLKNFEVSNDRH